MMKSDFLSRISEQITLRQLQLIAFILIITSVTVYGLSYETHAALKYQYQEKLVSLANTTAAHIDGDTFSTLMPGDENTPEFIQIRDFLYTSLSSDSTIFSIYTMRLNGTNLEFVVDAEYNISPDTPAIGENYDYISAYQRENPEIIRGFEEPIADNEYTTDEWGTVLSGFSPIRNSHNNVVGIVGIDVAATNIIADQNRLFLYFVIIGLIAIIISIIGIAYIEIQRSRDEEKIRESEERFKAVFSMVPNPIIITRESDGVILMCNDTLTELVDAKPDAFIGKRTTDLYIWPSDDERESFLHEIIRNGEVVNRELDWNLPDGTIHNVLYSSRRMKLQNEDCLLNVGWDITEIKRAEQALKDSEEMFRNPVEHSPVGVFLIQNSTFTYLNPRMAILFGYTPDELIAHSFIDLIIPEDHKRIFDIESALLNNQVSEVNFEFTGKRKDGSLVYLEVYASIMQYKFTPAIYGSIIDITSRKKAEEKLRRSEKQYRLIANNMKDVIWILNPETFSFRYISPSVKHLLGQSAAMIMSRPFEGTLISDAFSSLQDAIHFHVQQFLKTKKTEYFPLEVKVRHAQGHDIIIEIISNSFINQDTAQVDILGVCRDITERITYEAEIELKNIELSTAYEQSQASYEGMCAMEQERLKAYEDLSVEQEILRNTQKTLNKAQKIAHLGNYEWKIPDNEIYISDEFRKIFEIPIEQKSLRLDHLYERINVQDQERIRTCIQSLRESHIPFDTTFWINLNDGNKRAVRVQGEVEHDDGKTRSISLIVQDITKQKMMENQIMEAFQEKEILLREIHHRVKNNMQIISSLLSLQSKNIRDPSIKALFQETQNRVQSLALVHELLYQSDNLNKINYRSYLQKISSYLLNSDREMRDRISCTVDSDDVELTIEKAIPCSLIVTEMITNSIKYAFSEKQKGEIFVRFRYVPDKNEYRLEYQDNGKGLPPDYDIHKSSGFGSSLISGLTSQLSGTLEIEKETTGVHFIITFPPEK